MKLTIERAALLKSLAHVQSVVERRNTIPILSNVKLEAGDGAVRLNATDMDLDIVEQAVADVATPGSTTVSAHTLYDIVRKLPDGAHMLLLLRDNGRMRFFTHAARPEPRAGDIIISFSPQARTAEDSAAKKALKKDKEKTLKHP